MKSRPCTQAQLESPEFRAWAEKMKEPFRWHRKLWEHCFIAEALKQHEMLQPGKRGLGFAVGQEPLPALFASCGCEILATDMDHQKARQSGWVETGQHSSSLASLNRLGLCEAEEFSKRVRFRTVDMTHLPSDLRDFDFCWSACAFEHLGTIASGERFIFEMMRCLKPGGIAVHTTEFNVSSNVDTRDNDDEYVLFRRRDIENMARRLRSFGHDIDVDFTLGTAEKESYVDPDPFTCPNRTVHMRLKIEPYVVTSIGLVIEKGRRARSRRLLDAFRARA